MTDSPASVPPKRLEDLSAPAEVLNQLTADSILLWPLGAIEQHGPHLPLNVDAVIAEATATAAAQTCAGEGNPDVWLLPLLPVTKSNEHAWAPGTLWLSAETMLAVVKDVGRCLATTPARRLVFLNAHGGNSALLNMACRELRLAFGLLTFLAHPFVPADQGGASAQHELAMGIHGGHDETSMMLHLRPELVDMGKASRRIPEHLADNKHVRFGGSVTFGWLSDDFGADGHIGDPTQATAEVGAQLFDQAVGQLVEQLREVATFSFQA